jgi:glutathione S-transferase
VRLADRIFDLYVHDPMQRIVGDRLRPEGKRDPHGVEMARAQLRTALDMTEARMTSRTWAAGETFSMADCAAAPALFYANKVMLFADTHRNTTDYLARLQQRPSFARVLEEAKPYFAMFPQ